MRSTGLGMVIILANVLLVTVVAIGISERGFSGWWDTLRGEWQDPLDSLQVDDPFAVEEPADDPVVTTAPAPTVPPDDAGVTTAPPTQEPTEDPDPPTVMERYEEGEDLTVLVLGDQTGTDTNDWVGAWSRLLANDRLVELRTPTAADPTQYNPPIELGGGDSQVALYNASLIGGTPDYAAERLPLLAPEEPDLVLLNFGRSNSPEDLPDEFDDLWDALGDQFPQAEAWVIVAPQRTDGLEPTVQTTRDWADDVDAPVVDVAQVFEEEGLTWSTVSTRDPLSVNIFGGERWAQIVHETVLGDIPPVPVAPQASPEQSTDVAQPQPELPPVEPGQPPVEPAPPPYQPPNPPPYEPPPYQPPPYQPPPAPTPTPTPSPTPTPDPPDPTEPDPTEPDPTEPTDPPDPADPAEPTDPHGSRP